MGSGVNRPRNPGEVRDEDANSKGWMGRHRLGPPGWCSGDRGRVLYARRDEDSSPEGAPTDHLEGPDCRRSHSGGEVGPGDDAPRKIETSNKAGGEETEIESLLEANALQSMNNYGVR